MQFHSIVDTPHNNYTLLHLQQANESMLPYCRLSW